MNHLTGLAMPYQDDDLVDADPTISAKNSGSTLNTLWSSQGSSVVGLSRSQTPNTIYSQLSIASTRTQPTLISRHYQNSLPPVPLFDFVADEGPAGAYYIHEHDTLSSCPSKSPLNTTGFHPAHYRDNTRYTSSDVKPTKESKTAEKKAHNPFACPYCPETFSKSSDRKKHFNNRCKSLGDGAPAWECLLCHHLARSESQIKDHQRKAGHPKSGCRQIHLPTKPRFTCSDDGIIYTDVEDFLEHFAYGSPCRLNEFNSHGDHSHRARLRTLLQEGRDDVHGHTYIYAELRAYCAARTWPAARWKEMILSLPEEVAEHFAAKLEWGLVPDEGTALSRLGFTDLSRIVEDILSSDLPKQVESDMFPSMQASTAMVQHGASLSRKPVQNQDLNSRFAAAASPYNASYHEDAKFMYPEGHFQNTWVQSPIGHDSIGDIAAGSFNRNVLPDQDNPLLWNLDSCDGCERIIPEMKQAELCNPSPVLESWTRELRSSPHELGDNFILYADSVDEEDDFCHREQYDARLLEPEPTKRKTKRPISEGSRVLPEEIARAVNHHAVTSPPMRTKENPKKSPSQHSSNGSTGGIFDFQKYYNDDEATAQVPQYASPFNTPEPIYLIQGAPTPAPSTYFVPAPAPPSSLASSSPQGSFTSKAKAYIQSLPSASLRNGVKEINDLSEQDAFGQPSVFTPRTSTGTVAQLRCLHCRQDDCYLGIACPAMRKGRRSGGVYGRQNGEWRIQS
ncbi:unnamed protein product [Zymoseptoria tritici ST99CH_1A5]|nr:unnamed protein product [Zymoseptoria tritici ST99CH_1A5]